MTKVLGIACLMLIALSVEAAARCSVPVIRTFENQTVDGRMWASSGKPCTIRFLSSSGPIHRVEIVQRPTNGSVQVGGILSLIYKSRPGFVGSDSFTYARHGLTKGGAPTTRTVRVAVTVEP
jgi:hypothetical protein